MAHKVNPMIFRLNVTRKTNSEWFAVHNDYPLKLHYDLLINRFFKNISEQYKFLFEKCQIKEYLGKLELIVYIHPYAFRKKKQKKCFILFISAAKKILPILQNQMHGTPILKIINLPETVPYLNLKNIRWNVKRYKYKFIRVKKLFMRHIFIINTAIYRSSSILLASIIAQGIGSRNRDHKTYIKFLKSVMLSVFWQSEFIEGLKIHIKGKIHGRRRSRRTRKQKIIIGSIPYSKITTNVNYTFRHTVTKFGVFSVKVWIYTKYPKDVFYPKVCTSFLRSIKTQEREIKYKIEKHSLLKTRIKIKRNLKRYHKSINILQKSKNFSILSQFLEENLDKKKEDIIKFENLTKLLKNFGIKPRSKRRSISKINKKFIGINGATNFKI